jgi:hypothetical protein
MINLHIVNQEYMMLETFKAILSYFQQKLPKNISKKLLAWGKSLFQDKKELGRHFPFLLTIISAQSC